MIDIKQMLAMAIEAGASDVHINIEMPPIMRINTELLMMDLPEVSNDDAGKMILEMIGEDKFKKFLEKRDWDFSTMIDDGSRFRVNAHFQKESFAISFRAISNHIPDIEELHLPDVVTELTDLPRGLVVVTGSTSLASKRNSFTRCTSLRSSSSSSSSLDTTSQNVTSPEGAMVRRNTSLPSRIGFCRSARL